MDHSHSPHGAAVPSASAQLRMSHSHPPHGAAVSSASAQLPMAGSDNDGTPHARGRRGRRDNPPSHLHGAPSATNQPTLSRGCGDHPHSHPPHHEGMRDQSLSLSSGRVGDINGLKTPTSAPFTMRSAGSSTTRPTASSTKRHPRLDDSYTAAWHDNSSTTTTTYPLLWSHETWNENVRRSKAARDDIHALIGWDDSYAAAPSPFNSPFNDQTRQHDNAPTSYNSLLDGLPPA